MDLYKRQRISSGKGAEILGVGKYDFIKMLADEGIDYFDYSSLELKQEFKVIDSIRVSKAVKSMVLMKANENQDWGRQPPHQSKTSTALDPAVRRVDRSRG